MAEQAVEQNEQSAEQVSAEAVPEGSLLAYNNQLWDYLGLDPNFGIQLLTALLVVYPLMRIFARAGLSKYWALSVFTLPIMPILSLTVPFALLAHKTWPNAPVNVLAKRRTEASRDYREISDD